MQFWIWVVTGVLAGYLAGFLMKGRDYGLTGNLILGLGGSLVGGWVMALLGFNAPGDLLRHGLVSLLGAMLVLGVARRLRPVSRQGRRVLGDVATAGDLEAQFKKLGDFERRVVDHLRGHATRPRDANATFDAELTFGQRVADRVASFGGSWTFIGLFLLMMLIWMIVNSVSPKHFDPFPFILLNLVLSCLAALQAPVIMMSQNRQSAKDRIKGDLDYKIDLKAELEIAELHKRVDAIYELLNSRQPSAGASNRP